jgi:tetratricopeptide (TPR) repeat protein
VTQNMMEICIRKTKNEIERRAKVKSKVRILTWAGVVVLMSCFLFCTWGCKTKMDKAKKHYEVGVEYHKKQQADQAIEEFLQAIKIDPNYAEAHYELGILYHEKAANESELKEYQQADEDYKNALRELQQAIRVNPDYAEAHFRLGIIYQVIRGYDRATMEFEEVQRINPNFPRIHTALGNVYYERGIRAWGRAIKLDWSYLLADTLKEISYKNIDELKEAIGSYRSATESDSTDPSMFSKLSQAYYTWAQDEYQKAIGVNPSDTNAQLQLGLIFSEKGYQNKAMKQYEVLKNLDPRAADMLLQVLRQKEQEEQDLKRRGLRQ